MSWNSKIETYLYDKGWYNQAFDHNAKLLENIEVDHKYKFYLAFHRIGDNPAYGTSKAVFLPFIVKLDNIIITLHCIHPYL